MSRTSVYGFSVFWVLLVNDAPDAWRDERSAWMVLVGKTMGRGLLRANQQSQGQGQGQLPSVSDATNTHSHLSLSAPEPPSTPSIGPSSVSPRTTPPSSRRTWPTSIRDTKI
ncbi:unnamed protein product [Protopolystoma xenopodis]|uniref:Uncharacterized protein n=1 Tax=Protopolystoma xenopodis TaxID=117903 RepID=A0A448WPJ1_9PLAT|nr:unnamed protein product [Protopolystoma xenopodis]